MADPAMTTESTVYVTYIASPPEKVWAALTAAEFTAQYFFGRRVESDWRPGSPWALRKPDGAIDVRGVVRESRPPRRLVVSWNVDAPSGGPPLPECVVTYEIDDAGAGVVRLTMTEAHPTPIPAVLLEGGRRGWPMILSGLKTLLETGRPLALTPPKPPQTEG
jgi:uncharacterized protein YndB with AHSA1/START domain